MMCRYRGYGLASMYEDTKELWQEGNFLLINGKVKIKEERVQVTCDAVETFNQEVQA